MKKAMLLIVGLLWLATPGLIQAQETALHGVIDLTYQSKYIWRGFDVYADKSAVQGLVDLSLCDSGFGISAMGHRANASGFENAERWDYTLYYQNQLFAGETYATNCRLGWVYYNYPELSYKNADLQELQAVFSLPKICPNGIVPSYVLVKLWPSKHDSWVANKFDLSKVNPATGGPLPSAGTASGFAHIFMLDYPLVVEGLLPEIPEHILNLHAELVYNDGVGPAGQNVDHDWSNAVFGVSTDFDLGGNFILTPGIYYQATLDMSVNDDKDETWATLGLKYKF